MIEISPLHLLSTKPPSPSQRPLRTLGTAALILVCLVAGSREAEARAKTGIQAIGISAWANSSVDALAKEIKTSRHNVEVACLPFNFKPRSPFTQLSRLVKGVLEDPGYTAELTITVYMSFHRDEFSMSCPTGRKCRYKGLPGGDINWSRLDVDYATFKAKAKKDQFLREYERRLGELLAWMTTMRGSWPAGRLQFIVCPSLEDSCSESHQRAYTNLVAWTVEKGITVPMRRSSLFENAWRPKDMAMELHGDPAELLESKKIVDGDWISNDGCDVRIGGETGGKCAGDNADAASLTRPTLDGYLRDWESLRNGSGVSVTFLVWRAAYNINNGDKAVPRDRGRLIPLSRSKADRSLSIATGEEELKAVRKVFGK